MTANEDESLDIKELNAYVDGELSGPRRRRVERTLARDPAVAARVATYRRQDDDLRRAWAGLAEERQAALKELIATPVERRPGLPTRTAAVAAAGILALAVVAGGWWWSQHQARQTRLMAELAHQATTAHFVYSRDLGVPVDRGTLARRFAAAIGTAFTVPDLSRFGLHLVGARELRDDDGAAVLLVYADAAGQRVSCYFVPLGGGETAFALKQAAGLRTLYRLDEGIGYAVVGALPAAELRVIAATAYPDAGT